MTGEEKYDLLVNSLLVCSEEDQCLVPMLHLLPSLYVPLVSLLVSSYLPPLCRIVKYLHQMNCVNILCLNFKGTAWLDCY